MKTDCVHCTLHRECVDGVCEECRGNMAPAFHCGVIGSSPTVYEDAPQIPYICETRVYNADGSITETVSYPDGRRKSRRIDRSPAPVFESITAGEASLHVPPTQPARYGDGMKEFDRLMDRCAAISVAIMERERAARPPLVDIFPPYVTEDPPDRIAIDPYAGLDR